MTSGPGGDEPSSQPATSSTTVEALAALASATDRASLVSALASCVAALPADAYALAACDDRGVDLEIVGAVERGGTPSPAGADSRLSRALHPVPGGADEPFVSEDVASDARLPEATRRVVLERLRMGALIAFPLIHQGDLVGSFIAGSRGPRAFAPEERKPLWAIARVVGAVLSHLHDRAALGRKVKEVRALYRAGEALAAIGDETVLLQRATVLLVSEIRYAGCWVAMLRPSGDALRAVAGAGGTKNSGLPDIPLEDRSRLVVETFHRGTPAVYADIQARADREGWGEVARRLGYRCVVAVPLRVADATLGVLCVGITSVSSGDDSVSLLAAFGSQLANAVMRVRMDREREQQMMRLQDAYEQQANLLEVVRELSTPVIPVHDGVVVLPLVGTIDSTRSAQIMESLLAAVQRHRAAVVIVDVTGVPVVDSAVASHLLQAVRATELLGARCVVVGISPQIAQTIVQLDIDLSGVVTCGNLQAGIAHALRVLRLEIRPARGGRR